MAINEIKDYAAVVTPATTDDFICQQRGVTRNITSADILEAASEMPLKESALGSSALVMGTQSGSTVKISLEQIRTYYKSLLFGVVFGGSDASGYLDDCNRYSSAVDTWGARTAIVDYARSRTSAFSVSGLGYLCGGRGASSRLKDCDRLTMDADTWANMTDMGVARSLTSAAEVEDAGYVLGGYNGTQALKDNDRYNVSGNSWSSAGTPLADMEGRLMATAAVGIREKLFRFGGSNSISQLGSFSACYGYNTSTDVWYIRTSMNNQKMWLAAAAFSRRTAYTFGGYNRSSVILDSVEMYEEGTDNWTTKTEMNSGKYKISSSRMDRGYYTYGGEDSTGKIQDCSEFVDVNGGVWTEKTDMTAPAKSETAAATLYG